MNACKGISRGSVLREGGGTSKFVRRASNFDATQPDVYPQIVQGKIGIDDFMYFSSSNEV